MADPRTLLEQIDAVIHHHDQLAQWGEPESDGSIYPQQAERERLARVRDYRPCKTCLKPLAMVGHAECGLCELACGGRELATAPPPDTPSTTDHIGDEEWGRQQVEAMPALLVKATTMTPEEVEAFQRR